MSSGATKKKRKKKSEFEELISKEIASGAISPQLGKAIIAEHKDMRRALRKTRTRVKELEQRIETDADPSFATLHEKLVALNELVESYDIRQTQMGIALRQCMRALGVKRGDGDTPAGG